ncbi:MAG: hypothetical protein V1861_07060 [Candidatus Micrarchaeota archaeon]
MEGERALERRVEEAEHATNRVVSDQRERVGQAVPVRIQDQASRIEENMQRAMESLFRLSNQGDRVREHLTSRDIQNYLSNVLSSRLYQNPETAYREANRGHEAPERVFHTPAEAGVHSNELLREARTAAAQNQQQNPPVQPPREEKGFFARLWDSITSVFDAIKDFFKSVGSFLLSPFRYIRDQISDALISTNAEITQDVTERWLSETYLGATIRSRLMRTPPVATTESVEFFNSLEAADRSPGNLEYGIGAAGMYYPGTNHITLASPDPERGAFTDDTEANRRELNAHEQLHYASWLGGGHEIRWRDEQNQPHVTGHIKWLHEGLTELHAQQLTRSHGFTPSYVSYPYEVATGFYLQQLVGEDVLRSAYLTGDFTEVRRRLDNRLGAGTFDRMAGMSMGVEALEFITSRMSAGGINFTAWESNPVLAGCYRDVATWDRVR